MNYDFIAIPDAEIPKAVEPIFQHVVITYILSIAAVALLSRAGDGVSS